MINIHRQVANNTLSVQVALEVGVVHGGNPSEQKLSFDIATIRKLQNGALAMSYPIKIGLANYQVLFKRRRLAS